VPRTDPVSSRGGEHDRTVLAVGAVVLVGVLSLGAWAVYADAASATPPNVTVSWTDGPGGSSSGSSSTTTTTTTTPTPAPPPSGATGGQPSSVSVSGAGGSASLSQTIGVSVLPGPLTVSPASQSVTLARRGPGSVFLFNGESFGGPLGRITVVDARGSLVGWRASVTLLSVNGENGDNGNGRGGAVLCVTPDAPTMVAGNPADIVRADRPSCGRIGQSIPVFFAAPNGGGGNYSDAGSLNLVLPRGRTGQDQVTANLAVSVS
jgi:hypothetical protein